jgi:hypothetical protein
MNFFYLKPPGFLEEKITKREEIRRAKDMNGSRWDCREFRKGSEWTSRYKIDHWV